LTSVSPGFGYVPPKGISINPEFEQPKQQSFFSMRFFKQNVDLIEKHHDACQKQQCTRSKPHTKIFIMSSVLAGTNYKMELHSITVIP
jgi:hypothetical protein